jgi:autophagy-related protein 16
VNCIGINYNGTLLATGSNDKKLILVETQTGASKASLIGATKAIMSVDFSKTTDMVLASSEDNSTKIWDLETFRLKHTLTGHLSTIYSSKFIDDKTVVSGSHDRTIKIWDLKKGFCKQTIFTLSSCNDVATLLNDGGLIVSGHLGINYLTR